MVRRTRQATERGAAIFIVVLVITLLTAIGIFAARASSLVEVAVGHNRQSLQTIYLADYGARSALAMVSGASCGTYVNLVKNSVDVCDTNRYARLTPREIAEGITRLDCARIYDWEVTQRAGIPVLQQQLASQEGSLGPGLSSGLDWSLNGLWVTELTGISQLGNMPGMKADDRDFQPYRLALTTYAQIRTGGGTVWCGDANSSTSASVHAVRAHVVLPGCSR